MNRASRTGGREVGVPPSASHATWFPVADRPKHPCPPPNIVPSAPSRAASLHCVWPRPAHVPTNATPNARITHTSPHWMAERNGDSSRGRALYHRCGVRSLRWATRRCHPSLQLRLPVPCPADFIGMRRSVARAVLPMLLDAMPELHHPRGRVRHVARHETVRKLCSRRQLSAWHMLPGPIWRQLWWRRRDEEIKRRRRGQDGLLLGCNG